MRLSIIAILISLSAIGYGQAYLHFGKDSFELEPGMLIIDQGNTSSGSSELYWEPNRDSRIDWVETEVINVGDTTYYWPAVESDTIKQGERLNLIPGNGITINYSPGTANDLLNLYDRYLLERPTATRHETDISQDIFLEDCNLIEESFKDGIDSWFTTKCINPEHQKEFPVKPTFEGFIKWLRTQ